MMLHRHFEPGDRAALTTTEELSGRSGGKHVSDGLPSDEDKPKRGRRKKTET